MISRLMGTAIACFVFFQGFEIRSQSLAVGARSASLAGISAGLADPWSAFNNPAGLGRYSHLAIATNLEQRFLMKELGYYALAGSIPAGKGCFGISTLYEGYSLFTEQKAILGYGRQFGGKLASGISLVYIFQNTGNDSWPVHQVSYSLGAIVMLSEKSDLAFVAFNPFLLYYKSEDYATLPANFKLGFTYHYASSFYIYTELEKDLELPFHLKLGLECMIREVLYIRGGISGLPASYSFGTAIRHQRFLLEFSSSYHQYLGFTPQLSLQFDFR